MDRQMLFATMETPSTLTLPDGATLAYEIRGQDQHGEPLVIIPGMTNIRSDFYDLGAVLCRTRPVLVLDHRGMGHSKCASEDDTITIESMARDLLALLVHVGWKKISFLGYSMGGVILQQLLLLPYRPTNPTQLCFIPTHVVLSSTRSIVLPPELGVPFPSAAEYAKITLQERVLLARKILQAAIDPEWVKENEEKFEDMFRHVLLTRDLRDRAIIAKQLQALRTFDLTEQLIHFPRDTKVLVIHGERDQIVPMPFCQDTLKRISQAKFIECGEDVGRIPSLEFGHAWWHYFDMEIWFNVIDRFLNS